VVLATKVNGPMRGPQRAGPVAKVILTEIDTVSSASHRYVDL